MHRDGSTVHVLYKEQFSSAPARSAGGVSASRAAPQRLKKPPVQQQQQPRDRPGSGRAGQEGGRWITEHLGVRSQKVGLRASEKGTSAAGSSALRPAAVQVYLDPRTGQHLTGTKAYKASQRDKAASHNAD